MAGGGMGPFEVRFYLENNSARALKKDWQMHILRTEKQKDNLAKFFWDDAKIALAALVLGPITRPDAAELWVVGLGVLAAVAFAVVGYLFDGMEVSS